MNAINNLMLATRIVDALGDVDTLVQFFIVPLNRRQIKKDWDNIKKRSNKLEEKNAHSTARRLARIEFVERLLNEKE